MTTQDIHFEGQTNGVGMTLANSDDFGDYPGTTVIVSTTMTYTNALAAHGTMSLKVDGGLTNPSNGYVSVSGLSAATNFAAQFYLYLTALPSSNQVIFSTLDSASGPIDQVFLRADGTYMVGPYSSTYYTSVAGGGVLSLNTWYRFDFTKITATSGGKVQVTVNPLDSTANAFGTIGPTSTSTGSTAIAKVRIGKQTGSVPMDTFYMDDIRLTDAQNTALSPYSPPANVPPTTTISPATYTGTLGGALSITGTAADSDGSIASRTWTCTSYPGSAPTLTGATTNTVTFTPATAGVYKFQFTCTDNLGASPASPATATVYVPASNVTVNANPTNTGSWSGTYTDLADGSDATYVQSTGSGTDTFTFNPATPSTSAYITVRAAYVDAGATINWSLLQGTTTIASGTLSGLTASPANYTLTLTSGQASSITDWTALKIAFS